MDAASMAMNAPIKIVSAVYFLYGNAGSPDMRIGPVAPDDFCKDLFPQEVSEQAGKNESSPCCTKCRCHTEERIRIEDHHFIKIDRHRKQEGNNQHIPGPVVPQHRFYQVEEMVIIGKKCSAHRTHLQ
jgi:hypothetical protein